MAELNARSRCALNFAHPSSRTTVINLNPVIQHVGSVTERLTTWLTVYDRRHLRNRSLRSLHGNVTWSPLLQAIAPRTIIHAPSRSSSLRREPCIRGHRPTTHACLSFGSAITIILRDTSRGICRNDKDDGTAQQPHIEYFPPAKNIRPSSAQGLVTDAALSCCI